MKRHTLVFQTRFADAVERGEKVQTIRPPRKRVIGRGDTVDLRAWSGAPYRSKQRMLGVGTVTEAFTVRIDAVRWRFFGDVDEFARMDGFQNWEDMLAWFGKMHGLPFEGVLIRWRLNGGAR